MKIFVTILLVLLAEPSFAQTKGVFQFVNKGDTSSVPFLYLGRDTLDYICGGSTITQVNFTRVYRDSIKGIFQIEGDILDAQTGELVGEWGCVFLGKIVLQKAVTWLGEVETGVIVEKSDFTQTQNGRFSVSIPFGTTQNLVVATLGGSVLEFTLGTLEKVQAEIRTSR